MPDISKTQNNNLTSHLRASAERAASYAQQARSENTKKSYQSDWAHFTAWCLDHDLVSMPATMQTVILYITEYAEVFKVSTLERRLASISQAHKTSGYDSPALVSKEPLHSVWSGIARSKSTRRDKVAPVLTDDIKIMISHLERDPYLASLHCDLFVIVPFYSWAMLAHCDGVKSLIYMLLIYNTHPRDSRYLFAKAKQTKWALARY